jgi:hypothetical protein
MTTPPPPQRSRGTPPLPGRRPAVAVAARPDTAYIDIDHDDNMDDCDALFGFGNDDTAGGSQPQASPATPTDSASPSTASTTSVSKRGRKPTSDVWNDFEQLYKVTRGKRVRYAAKCHYCKAQLSASGGIGHLRRHRDSCAAKAARASRPQSLLQFHGDNSVRQWDYNAATARTELCRLLATLDLPLGFGGHPAFERYIRRAHNPRFHSVCRQTTTSDFVKFFRQRRTVLIDQLQSSVSAVALTFDIWSGNAKEDYISVVAHFVNADWLLEKRVIGMRLIDVSHSGPNIAERVQTVIEEFKLTNKVFSVTLDNASANSNAMSILTPSFSGYVGSLFLHQRCACHIINLIVKSGLKRLKSYLEDFRTAISFLNASNQRIATYKSFCVAMGVRPRKFGLDMDVRWNSTYLMLKHLIPYKSTFSVFIQTHYQQVEGQRPLLTPQH